MSIIFHESTKVFHLHNDVISYIMMVLPNGQMGHLYFGKKIHDREDFGDLLETAPRPMCSCPFEGNKAFSLEYAYSWRVSNKSFPAMGRGITEAQPWKLYRKMAAGFRTSSTIPTILRRVSRNFPGFRQPMWKAKKKRKPLY